ncbi:unnamed protein product [Tuwongella immobilis]|uniref:Uncharacterized protein n=1 Tax=Tuwongella immobilis TaxID=692036 RepID=A0A6C2YWJ9_9BACT|nr:unnamed protein product [Tuwongella immobilis]VTS07954.1 unnamed protein product [Tuwongella immobilis]
MGFEVVTLPLQHALPAVYLRWASRISRACDIFPSHDDRERENGAMQRMRLTDVVAEKWQRIYGKTAEKCVK